MNIRHIIKYIYIDPPPIFRYIGGGVSATSQTKEEKRKKDQLQSAIALIQSKAHNVVGAGVQKAIQSMLQDIKGLAAAGNLDEALSKAEALDGFVNRAVETTQGLNKNIQKAKLLWWSLPPQARNALQAVIKAAEKALNGASDPADMKGIADALDRAVYLASRIAEAGPVGGKGMTHELQELCKIACDVSPMGTDHFEFSQDLMSRRAAEAQSELEHPGEPKPQQAEARAEKGLEPGRTQRLGEAKKAEKRRQTEKVADEAPQVQTKLVQK